MTYSDRVKALELLIELKDKTINSLEIKVRYYRNELELSQAKVRKLGRAYGKAKNKGREKMKRKELLRLISMVNEFDISTVENLLVIAHEEAPLKATIDMNTGECKYFATGCYDSGIDAIEIDMLELEALEHVATVLSKADTVLSKADTEAAKK